MVDVISNIIIGISDIIITICGALLILISQNRESFILRSILLSLGITLIKIS